MFTKRQPGCGGGYWVLSLSGNCCRHLHVLGVADFVRLLRFIRLWKKLGWTIEQTDVALCALFRADLTPIEAADMATVPTLDAGS